MDNRVPASPGLPLQGTRLPSPQLLAASQTNPLPELTPAIPVPASAPTLHPQTEATVSAAAAVARQIVHASQSETLRDTGGSVDIALDPPELGRVRLSLIEVNGTLCLSIAAERPETAELMRRHMGLLAQEFARAGLDPPSVDISQGGSDGWGEGRAPPGRTDAVRVPSPDAVAPTPAFPGPPPTKDGLDLRL
jgi:flagellar hook-length control protein FliK